jgi:biotin operon repressor BirA-like protein
LRDEILGILMSSRDRYISGEVVSQKLGVTRAAVWKHIKRLKDEGFLIDSVPNRGYRLNGWPDRLESAVLKGLLHTEEIGRCLEVHSTIDSTNIRCKELALKGAPHGTLILAEEQQRGRGRLGRTWVSPEGTGLWMSLLLRPALVPSQAFRITMVAALAVARAIKNTSCVEAGIKWPNDIIMGGRKVCGILTEVQVEPEMVQYAVVGIGVDVLLRNGAFPPAGDMNSPRKVSRFIDVALAGDGVYSTLDSTQNKIFTYDENGNLLYAFGGSGTQAGVFQSVSALAYQGTRLLVLDRGTGYVTVFRRTEYGDAIAKAINLRKNRKYDDSIAAWQEVLKHNPSFELAYSGVAQSNMRQEEYYEAMTNYKLGNNWDGYFKAFGEYRTEVVRRIILLIPLIAGIIIWALTRFSKYVKKVNSSGWRKSGKRTLWEELLYSFHIMFHPFDGFWDLKHEKRGSMRAAVVILLLVMAVDIFKTLVGGYVFINSDFRVIDIKDTVLKILIPFLLWCCANWGLTTLMDGEGTFKDIFVATAYSLMPIAILNIPVAIFSNFIVAQELQFMTFFTALSYGWAFLLIFIGVLVTNSYGVLKNMVTSAMSVIGMGFMAFISVLFINILQKMGTFISTIYNEITFRL